MSIVSCKVQPDSAGGFRHYAGFLSDLGYAVMEVVNAADYGMPRSRRVFFLGYKEVRRSTRPSVT